MNAVKSTIPEGQSGPWQVKRFEVTAEAAKFDMMRSMMSLSDRGRYVPAGTYTGLFRNGAVIMSDTPDEIDDHSLPILYAKGKCLVNGLGLGVVVEAMLNKPEVEHVTVIEKSADVIALVGGTLQKRFGDRLTIINADAYTWNPPKGVVYDVAWHDIWDAMCSDNLKEMATLHRRYGKRCHWQGSWGKERCQYLRSRGGCW